MTFGKLRQTITACEKCPRLRRYCSKVAQEKRKSYQDDVYWGKPVPGFGDEKAHLVIVGLAPAAHGANRTGRIFTGDQSGFWLYRALHRAEYANQFSWQNRDDGLALKGAYITCAVRCAPPDNKPSPGETAKCADYLEVEITLLKSAQTYLCLGAFALKALWPLISEKSEKRPAFKHGGQIRLKSGKTLLMSYHPSQQNTFTKRLTEPMFDAVFAQARSLEK